MHICTTILKFLANFLTIPSPIVFSVHFTDLTINFNRFHIFHQRKLMRRYISQLAFLIRGGILDTRKQPLTLLNESDLPTDTGVQYACINLQLQHDNGSSKMVLTFNIHFIFWEKSWCNCTTKVLFMAIR